MLPSESLLYYFLAPIESVTWKSCNLYIELALKKFMYMLYSQTWFEGNFLDFQHGKFWEGSLTL